MREASGGARTTRTPAAKSDSRSQGTAKAGRSSPRSEAPTARRRDTAPESRNAAHLSSSISPQPPIFIARFPKRRRYRFVEPLSFMAHDMQSIGKRLAIGLLAQSRICFRFIHRPSLEILEPCFNVPARHGDDHRIARLSPFDSILPTLLLQLRMPVSGRTTIRVDDDDQECLPAPSDLLELPREARADPLLSGSPSIG